MSGAWGVEPDPAVEAQYQRDLADIAKAEGRCTAAHGGPAMSDDPFAQPVTRCRECGATDGHFVSCGVLAFEVEARQVERNGVCPTCFLVRPCGCDDD